MRTTATTAQISGLQTWVRTVLLTAGLALIVAASPQPAGAEQIPQNPSDAATNQILACRMMGGTATSGDPNRTSEGLHSTTVTCRIPGLGGWVCFNGSLIGTFCWGIPPSGATAPGGWQDIQGGEVLPVLESGSADEINALLAEFEAINDQGPTAHPSVATGGDQEHDQDTAKSKSKKGKGKKGGNHRKK